MLKSMDNHCSFRHPAESSLHMSDCLSLRVRLRLDQDKHRPPPGDPSPGVILVSTSVPGSQSSSCHPPGRARQGKTRVQLDVRCVHLSFTTTRLLCDLSILLVLEMKVVMWMRKTSNVLRFRGSRSLEHVSCNLLSAPCQQRENIFMTGSIQRV